MFVQQLYDIISSLFKIQCKVDSRKGREKKHNSWGKKVEKFIYSQEIWFFICMQPFLQLAVLQCMFYLQKELFADLFTS